MPERPTVEAYEPGRCVGVALRLNVGLRLGAAGRLREVYDGGRRNLPFVWRHVVRLVRLGSGPTTRSKW